MEWRHRESFTWATVLALTVVSLAACTGPPAVPAAEDPFGVAWDDRSAFQQGLVGTTEIEGLVGATVYHIDVVINPELDGLIGREWVQYTNRETESLEEIYLQLFANATGADMAVSSLSIAGTEIVPVLEWSDTALRVALPTALPPGEAVTVQVDFDIRFGQEGVGSRGVLGYFDEFLLLDGFYPVVLVFDDEGWNVQELVPIGDMTYLDASFFLVRLTAPRDLDLVATGTEVERDRAGRDQVVTFAAGPARDFSVAAAPDLGLFRERAGETVINSYARSEDSDGAETALRFAVDALTLFHQRFGPYPYTEFDVIGTPMQFLGIEYPGMTTISRAMYDLESFVADLPAAVMLEGTVVHEVAHQWFYNVVGNDQLDEPWLDEALTQFLTGLYYREVYGDQAEQEYRRSWVSRWDRIQSELIPIGLSTSRYAAEEYSPIVYGRGPLFLSELEDRMGREEFAGFLRDYVKTNRWGIATGDGFRALAEQHCGCDLGEVFATWVDG